MVQSFRFRMTATHAERAQELLALIESRTTYLISQSHWAARLLLASETKEATAQPVFLTPGEIERYAPQWAHLIPDDPELRAAVGHQLAQKYGCTPPSTPRLWAALGLDQPAVQAAYHRLYGKPLEALDALPAAPAAPEAVSAGEADEALLRDIMAEMEWVSLARGDVLLRQGDAEDSMYILLNGRLLVVVEREGESEQVLNEIAPGETVGEMAILTGERRLATVYALRDSELVKFTKEDFGRLTDKHPEVIFQITRTIIMRLRQQTLKQRSATQNLITFCVIPASLDAPLRDFAVKLADALGAFGSTLHLNSERLDCSLEPGAAQTPSQAAGSRKVVAWLSEQETRHRFVVYEADPGPSAWTSRCLRQADRILIVASAEADPALSPIEEELLLTESGRATARKELVLLQPDRQRMPTGTARWLAAREITRHHHVHLHTPADFARLARFLTGRAVGVALGGGGARGFAHIGVLRALTELGVPIDCIGGTSMGAVIGAQHALGWDYPTMVEKNRQGWIEFQPMRDYTLPIVALLTGRKAVAALKMMCGETRIEDLWTNFFCVTSNLTSGEVMAHREGLLRKYLRASTSVPGIAPPVPDQGSLLVDGAALNNLPADIVRQLCEGGRVIAVNVTPRVDLATSPNYGDSLSAWEFLWSRINPFGEPVRVPTIQSILGRTMGIRRMQEMNELTRSVDLYLHPPVDRFGAFDLKSFDRLVEIGYSFARPKIEAWLQAQRPSGSARP